MFTIKFLPARFGDCMWISYGSPEEAQHILIDGGTAGTREAIKAELMALPADKRRLELVVVTHVDRDHIEGILTLLKEEVPNLEIGDFWFNGWPHLEQANQNESFGAVQGERLTARILEMDLPWNGAFDGGAVAINEAGPLPEIVLPGGMKLTLLTPTRQALIKLKPVWEKEVRDHNLDPGFPLAANDEQAPGVVESFGASELPDIEKLAESSFEGDASEANASSIALLAEFDDRRALLTADAHAPDLIAAIERLSPQQKLVVDCFKASHHGSKGTTSSALIEKLACPTFVFSTNGSIYKHPHQEAVARVIMAGGDDPELVFNYQVERNKIWGTRFLQEKYGYQTRYPEAGQEGVAVNLA